MNMAGFGNKSIPAKEKAGISPTKDTREQHYIITAKTDPFTYEENAGSRGMHNCLEVHSLKVPQSYVDAYIQYDYRIHTTNGATADPIGLSLA